MENGIDPLLVGSDNPLQIHYQRFRVGQRILLSGHSHQAWPDVVLQGQVAAFEDAANLVDDKWEAAFRQADLVREHLAALLDVPQQRIALGSSTHELLLRFLSCLPWKPGATIVTTDGEFHSMRRQLARLKELGVTILAIPVDPISSLAERMIAALDDSTVAVMASLVMFQDARIFSDVSKVVDAASQRSIASLVDTYHAINVFPFSAVQFGLADAFLVGGGYKYLQAGEGNCFLTVPEEEIGWTSRPVITGWFAEFAQLQQKTTGVGYGHDHFAFAGSTYDPTSHYRANAVFQFFGQQDLTPARLQRINQTQLSWLREGLVDLKLPGDLLAVPERASENYGGFLSLRSTVADQWVSELRRHDIYCDSRNGHLRLGPAPYVSRSQIEEAINTIGRIARSWSK